MLLPELADWLRTLDEVTLMELLDVTSDDLVERFMDKIEEDYSRLASERELMNGQ